MPLLLSVNVGLPRDVTWNGKRYERQSGSLQLMDGEWCADSIFKVMSKAILRAMEGRRAVFVYPNEYLSLLGALFGS